MYCEGEGVFAASFCTFEGSLLQPLFEVWLSFRCGCQCFRLDVFTTDVSVPPPPLPTTHCHHSFETSGRHQLSADRLSALASLAGVHTVSPSVNLVNDGIYTVVLSYQDTAQHAASLITHANVTFDTVTTPPVLSAPATVRSVAYTGL